MAKFFMHIRDGDTLIEDHDGGEHRDIDAARADAVISARVLVADHIREGVPFRPRSFEISDGEGIVLATVPFVEVLPRVG